MVHITWNGERSIYKPLYIVDRFLNVTIFASKKSHSDHIEKCKVAKKFRRDKKILHDSKYFFGRLNISMMNNLRIFFFEILIFENRCWF